MNEMTIVGGCIKFKDREVWEDNTLSARLFVWRNLINQTLWDLTSISLPRNKKLWSLSKRYAYLHLTNCYPLNGTYISRRFKYRQSSINAVSTNAPDSFNIGHWDCNWRLFMRNTRLVTSPHSTYTYPILMFDFNTSNTYWKRSASQS